MKAITQDRYGSADVLQLRDIERPTITDDEVLVRVRAAGVDPGVWHLMTGKPYVVRVAVGLRRPRVAVRGRDLAGVVEAVGANVTGLRPGDEVFGVSPRGTYAEYAVAQPRHLAPKPANISWAQAATAISGFTALQAVRDAAAIQAGQRVMVIGAGGGIGTYAVQLATAAGATVTAVCGPGKAELVRSLGADDVIDYTRERIDRDGPVYDAIIDTAGNRPLWMLRRALTRRGTLVLVGGEQGHGALLAGLDRQLRAPFLSMFVGQRLRSLAARERTGDLVELGRLIEAGTVTPRIDRTYPLAEAADAIRYLEQGHASGKVVVTVA